MRFPKFLRIASLPSRIEYIKKNGNIVGQKEIFDTTETKLTSILSQKLKFSYELVAPTDGEYGRQLPDGTWTGMVHRGEVDLAISEISVSEERTKVVRFTNPYFITPTVFATKSLQPSFSGSSFLKVFSFNVWIAIILSFLIMVILGFVLFKRKFSLRDCVYPNFILRQITNDIRFRDGFYKTLFQLFRMFFCWFYTAVLLSILTIPSLVGVRTYAELGDAVRAGSYESATFPGAFQIDIFLKCCKPNGLINVIGQNMRKNEGMIRFQSDIDEILTNAESSKNVAVITAEYLFLHLKEFIFISEEGFMTEHVSIAMKKNFCCKAQLDDIINYIWSSGIYAKLLGDATTIKMIKVEQRIKITDEEFKIITMENLKGVFIMLCAGYTLAIIVLFIEIMIHKCLSSSTEQIFFTTRTIRNKRRKRLLGCVKFLKRKNHGKRGERKKIETY